MKIDSDRWGGQIVNRDAKVIYVPQSLHGKTLCHETPEKAHRCIQSVVSGTTVSPGSKPRVRPLADTTSATPTPDDLKPYVPPVTLTAESLFKPVLLVSQIKIPNPVRDFYVDLRRSELARKQRGSEAFL